ncbi:MAG: Smr/MutS family protein [Gemmatimonadota bacterium]|nr:Smr/MutS family protein [Gemmatimonadota bacterium]
MANTDPPALTGIALLLSEYPVAKLDLHGMTGAQAEQRVKMFFATQVRISRGKVVHIITGKGTRSAGQPVLPGVVRRLLDDELVHSVAEVAGLPGGGGMAVRLPG